MKLYQSYINDVTSGKLLTGQWAAKAVQRHLNDIERSKSDDYPYYFDSAEADRYIKALSKIKLVEGSLAGQFFPIMPFQAFIVASLFGWKTKETGFRRFKRAYIQMAKKNAKTTLAAAISVIVALLDKEQGKQIYYAATTREQARICFDFARKMMLKLKEDSAKLDKSIDIFNHHVIVNSNDTIMRPVSSEAGNLEGKGTSLAIIDEYHLHKTTEVVDNLQSGTVGRDQSLLLMITTAGFNLQSPCRKFAKLCHDVLTGTKDDERLFAIEFSLDEEDDWHEEANWVKANPNIGQSPPWDNIRDEYTSAINEGATKEVDFKTKHMNIWCSTYSTWIQDDKWMASGEDFDPRNLAGRKAFGGLDLSRYIDLSDFVLLFPPIPTDPRYYILNYTWCPEEGVRDRTMRDGVPYMQWVAEGHMVSTSGNVIDYGYVENAILKAFDMYDIERVNYDRAHATPLITSLKMQDLPFEPYGQGGFYMNTPICEIEKLILSNLLNHGNNPVLRWMCSNVALQKDSNGNLKFDKSKSSEMIDGMVALAMAMAAHLQVDKAEPTPYLNSGIRTI